jgi:hypothetical protein
VDRNSLKASNETSSTTPPLSRSGANGDSSSRTDERFHLTGPSLTLDPRIHAYRKDIADIALAGQIFAPHYARPLLRRCGPEPAPVRVLPSADSEALATLAPDAAFAVLEYAGGWAWGYVQDGHLVGYVQAAALVDPA